MLNIYNEAYSFLLEILNDYQLQEFVFNSTGKHLAIINDGAKINEPCVSISLNGGSVTRSSNSNREIEFRLSFSFPFWETDAFSTCIDFIDFFLPILFDYKGNHMFILNAAPTINELLSDSEALWSVDFVVTVSLFI